MKKFATLMLALVMLISCAAIGMAEDITLDVIICQYGTQTNDWFTGTGMNGTSFVKKFEEANPGIKLNLEVVSWNDVYTVVSTRISNNNAPDILNLDSFADYANEGLLLPVKDYCPEELFNDFFPSFIAQSVIDDTVWAVPDLASARALYYNVDLLEAAGVEVPTTWAELEDVCQALVDFYGGGVYPSGREAMTHFFNWLNKDYANKMLTRFMAEEKNRKETEKREREQAEQKAARERHARECVTYEEYCRRNNIPTSGSLARDLERRI